MTAKNEFLCTSMRLATKALDNGLSVTRHSSPLEVGKSVWMIQVKTESDAAFLTKFFDEIGKPYPRELNRCLKRLNEG